MEKAKKTTESAQPSEYSKSNSLEYARRLYENVLWWYNSADTKAQVIITLNGVFMGFLTSFLFTKQNELKDVLPYFFFETWAFMFIGIFALLGSIASALFCLISRLQKKEGSNDIMNELKNSSDISPKFLWFFDHISQIDPKTFASGIVTFNEDKEIEALSSQISKLSENVSKKHRLVNWGFLFFSLSLLFFVLSGVSYILHAS